MVVNRILVIEDDLELGEVICLSLEVMAGLDVCVANTGQEGLRQAALIHPDAVLLDVKLPDMDGLAVCQCLRQPPYPPSLPIVLLTANRYNLDSAKLEALGVNAVLSKPFKPAQLAQQLLMILTPPPLTSATLS